MFDAILFPKSCVLCNKLGTTVCSDCEKHLYPLDFPICIVCENLSIVGKTHKTCTTKFAPKTFNAPFIYSKIAKDLIIKSKHGQNAYRIIDYLINHPINIGVLSQINSIDLVIPIPTKPNYKDKRIINHSEYIASRIKMGPILDCLQKTTSQKQKSQNKADREKSNSTIRLKANGESKILHNKKILIVDDVCTTGTTLISASRILIENGANEVHAYAICKDLRYNSYTYV